MDNTFELGGNGIILIAGKSGKGKTSILDGIFFALFGHGKKITTFGKRSCSVCLKYNDFKITRTRCPNRLLVYYNNKEYEEKVGQEIINSNFGDEQCYLKKSFLLSSSLDKLVFLEKLAFKHLNINQLKKQVKAILQSRENKLLSLDAKYSTMQTILSEKQKQLRDIPKPKYENIQNREIKIQNNMKRIANYRKRINTLQNQITATKVYEKFIESFNLQVKNLSEILDFSNEINRWKKLLNENQNYEKYLENLKIKEKLWIENSKAECEEMIEDYKQYLQDIKQVKKLNAKIDQLVFFENYTDMKLKVKTQLECPACSASLLFDEKKHDIQVCEKKINIESDARKKSDLYKKIALHEKNLQTRDILHERREDIILNYETFDIKEKSMIKEQLQNIKVYYKENLALESEYNSDIDDKIEKPKHTTEFISQKITEFQMKQTKSQHDQKIQEQLQEQKKIEDENFTYKHVPIHKLESRIKEHLENIKKKMTESEKCRLEIDQIKQYNLNKVVKEDCAKYKNSIEKFDNDKVLERSKINNSLLLKRLIKEAESIAIQNIINSLNTFAQNYLDIFFPSDPINVQIKAFKQIKKHKKPQINIGITYKGVECDLQTLSDGELQRVKVAFTLALGEMYQTPFILLDECTSNLDQESTEIVVDGMRQYPGKIILIAHQVVTGKFNNIINLN